MESTSALFIWWERGRHANQAQTCHLFLPFTLTYGLTKGQGSNKPIIFYGYFLFLFCPHKHFYMVFIHKFWSAIKQHTLLLTNPLFFLVYGGLLTLSLSNLRRSTFSIKWPSINALFTTYLQKYPWSTKDTSDHKRSNIVCVIMKIIHNIWYWYTNSTTNIESSRGNSLDLKTLNISSSRVNVCSDDIFIHHHVYELQYGDLVNKIIHHLLIWITQLSIPMLFMLGGYQLHRTCKNMIGKAPKSFYAIHGSW